MQSFNTLSVLNRTLCSIGLAAALLSTPAAAQPEFPFLNEDAQGGDTTSHSDAPATWLVNATRDWMSLLPDGKELNRISIPGTHDSGAQCCGVAVRTQTWTIAEQLDAGIRFLDIRVRATGDAWAIHHGDFFLKMMFGDVMNQVTAFLRAHPGEVVLMRIKEDKDPQEGSDSHGTIWANYLSRYRPYIYEGSGSSWPNLGAVRGKVFILSQLSGVSTSHGASWSSNDIQDYYKVFFLAHDQAKDGDWATLPAKRRLIKEQINKARQVGTGGGPLYINFLSGAQGMTPANVADYTNDTAYEHIIYSGGPRWNGLLVMDFPGEKLVYRTVKSNFMSSTRCAAKTFRVTSQKTWAEFRLPVHREGTTITIPGGAYNKYVFPKCNRVYWSDLTFVCPSDGVWVRTAGSWDSDAACHGSKGNSPYVFVGNR